MKQLRRTPTVVGVEKASDQWRTPPELFAFLLAEFPELVDLAASAENALADVWLGPGSTIAEDALAVSWADVCGQYPGFANPPYSATWIGRFLEKATHEATKGFTTICLVPCAPSTRWWQWTRYAVEIREIPHRVPFVKADGTSRAGAMFDSVVVIYRPQPGVRRGQPRRVTWSWRPEVKR